MFYEGSTGTLQALYQDLCAGDGTWATPNPRVLLNLPQLLLQLELVGPLTEVVTNLHFLVQQVREFGVGVVQADLEQASVLVKSVASKGVSGKGGVEPLHAELLSWEASVQECLKFI